MIKLLASNGSNAITANDLEYYIKRFFTRRNTIEFILFYLGNTWKNIKNYINNIYLGNIQNENCRKAFSLWFDALENPFDNKWALRMFDAIGKPPPNILAANINWLGNWYSCHKVQYANQSFEFKGRYCRAKIHVDPLYITLSNETIDGFPGDPAELLGIDLGLCVPSYCNAEDIASIVNNTLRVLTLHRFASIEHDDDVECEETIEFDGPFYFTLVLIILLVIIVSLATLYDCLFRTILNKPYAVASTLSMQDMYTFCNLSPTHEQLHGVFYQNLNSYQYQYSNRLRLYGMSYTSIANRNAVLKNRKVWYEQRMFKFHHILMELSAYTTILKPMSTTSSIKCLNGIRVLSMLWIILGHTLNYFGDQSYFLLLQNALDLLDFQKTRVDGQIVINTLYAVDTFFLLSAMLLTLNLLQLLKKTGMPNWYFWPMMYLERYLRLIPPYIMIFLFYVYVLPYIGEGPLWNPKKFPMENADCRNYWWAYFLLINNYVPNGEGTRCLGYYWYVSNDFQLFLLAPLFIIPLYYYPLIGSLILVGVLISSTLTLAFNIANMYHVGQVLVTLQAIWQDIYIKPYCRAGPYIIGIGLGYLFFKTDRRKIHFHPLTHLFLWSLTIICLTTSIFGNWINHARDSNPMSPSIYVSYFALSRIAWPLGLSWIIFSCYKGLSPVINGILSWNGFTFFAHTSYTTYLIHPMIIVYYIYSQKHLFYATNLTLFYIFFGHLVFSLLAGFLAHIFFERPFAVLFQSILPKQNHVLKKKRQ